MSRPSPVAAPGGLGRPRGIVGQDQEALARRAQAGEEGGGPGQSAVGTHQDAVGIEEKQVVTGDELVGSQRPHGRRIFTALERTPIKGAEATGEGFRGMGAQAGDEGGAPAEGGVPLGRHLAHQHARRLDLVAGLDHGLAHIRGQAQEQ